MDTPKMWFCRRIICQIDLYRKAGCLKDAAKVFLEILKSGVAIDIITFNTMIFTFNTMLQYVLMGHQGRLIKL